MKVRSHEIAASYGLDVSILGHAGDGNLHPTVVYKPDQLATVEKIAEELADAALALGRTLTGEHGIGTQTAQMCHAFEPSRTGCIRAIKRAFGPNRLLNSGVMLPPPDSGEPTSQTAAKRSARHSRMPTVLHHQQLIRLATRWST